MPTETVEHALSRQLFGTRGRPGKNRMRSSVSNGSRLLPGVDNRSVWVRRCVDLMADLTSDKGGQSEVTTAEAMLIRRAAVMSVELEALEKKFAQDGQAKPAMLDLYGRTAGNLRRVLETLGISRRPRTINVRPLDEIVAELEREKAAGDVIEEAAE
jgi:hypothetical protein